MILVRHLWDTITHNHDPCMYNASKKPKKNTESRNIQILFLPVKMREMAPAGLGALIAGLTILTYKTQTKMKTVSN